MTQRANDNVVAFVIKNPQDFSHVVLNMALDLRDARTEIVTLKARIAELERLSQSQSEAMDMMDRGAL